MITEKLKWLKCVLLSQCRIIKIKKYNFTIEYTHKAKLVTYSTIEGIYLSIFQIYVKYLNILFCQSIISLPLYRVKVSSYIKSLLSLNLKSFMLKNLKAHFQKNKENRGDEKKNTWKLYINLIYIYIKNQSVSSFNKIFLSFFFNKFSMCLGSFLKFKQ